MSGIEVGLRTGYALPLGAASGGGMNGSNDLNKLFNGAIPIWLDAGYRLPNLPLYVGAFFQYGIALINTGSGGAGASCKDGVSCTGSVIMFGVDAAYHILPNQVFDPWVGAGIGYEIGSFKASESGVSSTVGFNGVQFLNLQGGADYKVLKNLGVGPFVMFSLAEYMNCSEGASGMGMSSSGSCSIPNKAIHEWFTFGVRGDYDISVF